MKKYQRAVQTQNLFASFQELRSQDLENLILKEQEVKCSYSLYSSQVEYTSNSVKRVITKNKQIKQNQKWFFFLKNSAVKDFVDMLVY